MKNYWADGPARPLISRETIGKIPDEKLAWAMFDFIWFKVGGNYKRTRQVLAKLPVGFHVIYHLFTLDGEIGNGGFNQFFFNGLDAAAEQQLLALKLVRAAKHRRIFQRAFKIHRAEMKNPELQRRYAEGTLESFFSTYGMTELGQCDKEWYALDKELTTLQLRFIRRHPELFILEKKAPSKRRKSGAHSKKA